MTKETVPPKALAETLKAELLPQEARLPFKIFTLNRDSNIAMYESTTPEQFVSGIEKQGDSQRKDLIHQIQHTYGHTRAIVNGSLPSYQYEEIFPELKALQIMSREELIGAFRNTAEELYSVVSNPDNLARQVAFLYPPPLSGLEVLFKIMAHEAKHEGANTIRGDYFSIPRLPEQKKAWG